MKREDLLKEPEYWTAELQNELYRQITLYMENHNMNKTQLAEYLGCTKGYVTQLLNGDYDHKISKFVELSLAIGLIPEVTFTKVEDYLESDNKSFYATLSICKNNNDNQYYPSGDPIENAA